MAAPLPFAAGIDGLEGLFTLLFILVWIVTQVRNLFGNAGRHGPAGPGAARARPRGDAAEQQRELARRIDGLVRRAADGPTPPPPARKPRTPARPPAPPPSPSALGSLGGHAADVARHVDDAFAHEIAHLPAGGAAPPAMTPAPPDAAGGIAALLRDPAALGRLVIVREVLDRPVDRW